MIKQSNIIGEFLRAHRIVADLNLPQTAKRSGVAVSTILRVENGEMLPTISTLVSLSRTLDVDLTTLLAKLGAHTKHGLPEFEDYLRQKYNMPDDTIARIATYFRRQQAARKDKA